MKCTKPRAGDVSEDLPVCQPVCHPALSSPPLNHKKKRKRACLRARMMMMFMSTRAHASIRVLNLCLLHPSCGQMETSGVTLGVSLLKHPSPCQFHPPLPVLSSTQHLPPFFPLASLHSPSRNKSFNLTESGPRTWLQAVEACLCYYEETNLALYLTQ